MKLSISNIAWKKEADEMIYHAMAQYGFCGLEIAPTRWILDAPYDHIEEAGKIAEEMRRMYGYVVASMQSIWFGKSEKIFANEEERKELLLYTKKAIDFASAIGCKNLVFGCPKNRNIEAEWGLTGEQAEKIAVTFFRELGDYAFEKGTIIGLEANPVIYHTNFVNTTKEALALIEKVNSKGFLLNLDLGTMLYNEEDIKLLIGKIPQINHVHISEPGLKLVEKRELHKHLAEILRDEKYDKFVSIEMGNQEDVLSVKGVMQYITEVFHD